MTAINFENIILKREFSAVYFFKKGEVTEGKNQNLGVRRFLSFLCPLFKWFPKTQENFFPADNILKY